MASMLERYRALQKTQAVSTPVYTPIDKPVSKVEVKEPVKRRMSNLQALAKFGHTAFKIGQEEVINEVIEGKDGVLAVFPTGAGKSLIFQIPALVTGKLTVVVSPLISLMRDQVARLQSLGINAIFINSTVPMSDVKMALMEVEAGGLTALYVAPERFNNPEFMQAMQKIEIDVFAVDEVHCISKFGHDFRPSYAELGGVIERLKPRQVVALTATATPSVQDDICRVLGIEGARKFVRGLHRPNLRFMMFEGYGKRKLNEMSAVVSRFVREGKKTGIVYSPTRKEAEEICEHFQKNGIVATFYHAGLKDSERTSVQDAWAKDGGVIVATCAFGMGIDRPDVRFVIHSGLSQSVEDAVQAFGRAGRDGKESYCLAFWDMGQDYRTQMFLIDLTNPSGEDVGKFWNWIRSEGIRISVQGSKTAQINMTQKVMGEHSGCINVGGCISILKSEGLVKTIGRGMYEVALSRERKADASLLNVIRKDKIDKLNKMVSFYRCKECRVAFLCEYFGDMSFGGRCGVCDNCNRG